MKMITMPTTGSNPIVIKLNEKIYSYRAGQTYAVEDEVACFIENMIANFPSGEREPNEYDLHPVAKTSAMNSPVGMDEDGRLFGTDTMYTLPTATTSKIGGVKKAANVAASTAEDVAGCVTSINAILSALKTAGIMVADS